MYTNTHTKGYSLVEVLVAISILLLAIVGPMTIAAKGIQSSQYAREQTVAIFLAQEGIEAFIAKRNDEAIKAFASGNLSTSWDWVSNSTIPAACFTANGCNFDYTSTDPLSQVTACGLNGSGCALYFNSTNNKARYTTNNNDTLTPYRRMVKVQTIQGGKGLEITSTVSWNTHLFGTNTQSVTLTSSLFSIYE